MNVRSRHRFGCISAVVFLFLAGCSSGGQPPKLPDPVTVTGTVTLDDKPIDGVAVRFAPTTDLGYHGATGQTDASGKYELFTDIGNGQSRPGAVPGSYIVYVSRLVRPDGSLAPLNSKEPPMMSGARESLPMKYSTDKERLMYVVPEGGGTFDIQLDSKPVVHPGPSMPAGGGPFEIKRNSK